MPQRALFRHLMIASAVVGAFGLPAARVFAQATPDVAAQPDIETSKYSFVGEVNADGALLRSGPSENDYQVLKLNKGQKLTVVGMRFDWLKVIPPEGTFCLVPQAHIERSGDGSRGKVSVEKATVRIGSALSQAKMKVSRQLEKDSAVKIVGEDQEYYKIAPPEGVFMYVDKKFVVPVKRNDADGGGLASPSNPAGDPNPNTTPAQPSTPEVATGAPMTTETPNVATGAAPTDTSATKTNDKNFTVTSTTPPAGTEVVAAASVNAEAIRGLQEKLSKLEDRYAAAGQLELAQQPLEDLSKDYDALLADKQLPPNARKVAEYRATQLKMRKEALTQLNEAKKIQEAAAQKQRDLKVEQDELAARVAATQVKHFAAMGRLMQSSMSVNGKPLFRLIDPANSHLVMYVHASKVPVSNGLDQFVAVNGQVVQDAAANVTYIEPESFEIIDPKQVNTKVFADYAPASMANANVANQASAR